MLMTRIFVLFALLHTLNLNAQTYRAIRGEEGIAKYYADHLHGKATAHGEYYRREELTCAHPVHPKGTLLKVTRLDNGKSVTVRVNDRADFDRPTIIELSYAAATTLDLLTHGQAWVSVEKAGHSDANPVSAKSYPVSTPATGDQLMARGGPAAYTPAAFAPTTPRNLPSGSLSGAFGIQIGAFGQYDNALRNMESLRQRGISGLHVKETLRPDGSKIFRIVIGSFDNRQLAEDYLREHLQNNNIAEGLVIPLK
jgi:rare lipoprotein A